MIKVYWVKAHPKFAYAEGMTGEIMEAKFDELFKGGFIIPIPGTEPEVPAAAAEDKNTLPEDMPCREKLFEAGYKSVEEVRAIDDLLDVGVSKAMAGKIKKYLKG
jgi:hypothetical protein